MSEQEGDERNDEQGPPPTTLEYRAPRDDRKLGKPIAFSGGYLAAWLVTLASVALALGTRAGLAICGLAVIASIVFAAYHLATTGSAKFLSGLLAGYLTIVGLAFLALLVLCGALR